MADRYGALDVDRGVLRSSTAVIQARQARSASARRLVRLVVGGALVAGAILGVSVQRLGGAEEELSVAARGEEEEAALPDAAAVAATTAAMEESCSNYDDDLPYDVACPAWDFRAWCGGQESTSAGSALYKLCPDLCASDATAWAMVCAWEAVKSLPAACAGTFDGSVFKPTNKASHAAASGPALTLGGQAELYVCDAHAVCFSCYNPNNPGSTDDARYCEAVANYYGGFGAPYDGASSETAGATTNRDHEFNTYGGQKFIGANNAVRAIADDWDFWCSDSTLNAIEDGSFDPAADRR